MGNSHYPRVADIVELLKIALSQNRPGDRYACILTYISVSVQRLVVPFASFGHIYFLIYCSVLTQKPSVPY